MVFGANPTAEPSKSFPQGEEKLNELYPKIATWFEAASEAGNAGALIQSHDVPKEFEEIVKHPKEVAELIAAQGNKLLASIDYDKVIVAIDDENTPGNSPAHEIWAALTRKHGKLNAIRSSLELITEEDIEPGRLLWSVQDALTSLHVLKGSATPYLKSDENQTEETTKTADLPVLRDRVEQLIALTDAESDYQSIGFEAGETVYPTRTNSVLVVLYETDFIANEPLVAALERRVTAQEIELTSLGVVAEDLQKSETREEKIKRIHDLAVLSPALEIEFANEGIDTPLRILSRIDRLSPSSQSDYVINKLARACERLPNEKMIGLVETRLGEMYPEIDIEKAREFLKDENHSLRLYSSFSHCATSVQQAAISSVGPQFELKQGSYSDKDVINRVRALRYALDRTPSQLPEYKKISSIAELPSVLQTAEIQDDEIYAYAGGTVSLRSALVFAQSVARVPLVQVANEIVVGMKRFADDGSPVVYKASKELENAYHYSFQRELTRSVIHEAGELLVTRMSYQQIAAYTELFMQEQQSQQPFVTSYSHTSYIESRELGIKEDLCEAISLFGADYSSHVALYKSSPNRYLFLVGLMTLMVAENERDAYKNTLEIMLANANASEVDELKPTQAWDKDAKLATGGQVTLERQRVKTMVAGVSANEQTEAIQQERIVVFAPAIQIVAE